MVSTAAAGSLQIDAPSISPSTSSITQQVSSANAGGPPPSEASSSVVEITEKTSPTAAALAVFTPAHRDSLSTICMNLTAEEVRMVPDHREQQETLAK